MQKINSFRTGLTLVLSEDIDLKINLATELASKYGKRLSLRQLPHVIMKFFALVMTGGL